MQVRFTPPLAFGAVRVTGFSPKNAVVENSGIPNKNRVSFINWLRGTLSGFTMPSGNVDTGAVLNARVMQALFQPRLEDKNAVVVTINREFAKGSKSVTEDQFISSVEHELVESCITAGLQARIIPDPK